MPDSKEKKPSKKSKQNQPWVEQVFDQIGEAPEEELHHPLAPWRKGSYEHVDGKDYPDCVEPPPYVVKIQKEFPKEALHYHGYRGDPTLLLKPGRNVEILRFLRDDPDCAFDYLRETFGVDNLNTPERVAEYSSKGFKDVRFEVIFHLYSMRFRHDLRLRFGITEKNCSIQSARPLYKAADWMERETWEMFGINFEGHPNLTRLITHAEFEGYPLRKDYPINRRHNIRTSVEL